MTFSWSYNSDRVGRAREPTLLALLVQGFFLGVNMHLMYRRIFRYRLRNGEWQGRELTPELIKPREWEFAVSYLGSSESAKALYQSIYSNDQSCSEGDHDPQSSDPTCP